MVVRIIIINFIINIIIFSLLLAPEDQFSAFLTHLLAYQCPKH